MHNTVQQLMVNWQLSLNCNYADGTAQAVLLMKVQIKEGLYYQGYNVY